MKTSCPAVYIIVLILLTSRSQSFYAVFIFEQLVTAIFKLSLSAVLIVTGKSIEFVAKRNKIGMHFLVKHDSVF